jgi:acyl transferase domain-containing protein
MCTLIKNLQNQGAQWHAMGTALFDYQVFRNTITYLDEVLGLVPKPPTWSLLNILSGNCNTDAIQSGEISQCACTALQVGLVDLLASWSIFPSGVVGHSSGEIAAAYASGRISAAEAIVAAYYRGQILAQNRLSGSMLAVGLAPEQVSTRYLGGHEDEVWVAAINSPSSVTLSGDTEAIQDISKALRADGIFNRLLNTGGNAYHSHHMAILGPDYMRMLQDGLARIRYLGLNGEQHRYPKVPWVSSVTPDEDRLDTDIAGWASYWRLNLESPVRFSEAVSKLVTGDDLENHINSFVEIGPHAALKGPLNQIVQSVGKPTPYSSAMMRNEDGMYSILQLVGSLFKVNYPGICFTAVNATDDENGTGLRHGSIATDLPPYQYSYGPVNYHESRVSKDYRFRDIIRHDLLGSKIPGVSMLQPQWRNILRTKDLGWLEHHRLPAGEY